MQRLTPRISAIAAATGDFSTPTFTRPRLARVLGSGVPAALAMMVRVLRTWRERERERRELAMLSPRDLDDIGLSFSSVRDEISRWPWQRPVLSAAVERSPEPEPKVDAMQCIVFPFAAQPAPAVRRRLSKAA
jgi:uncharacterized protein YjiS (DUF1127 family)